MRKILLYLFCLTTFLFLNVITSSGESENWKIVVKIDNPDYPDYDETENYLDLNSIINVNGYKSAWTLINYAKRSSYGHISHKIHMLWDCQNKRYKPIKGILYKKKMGQGQGKSEDYNIDWLDINPEIYSASSETMKMVCK